MKRSLNNPAVTLIAALLLAACDYLPFGYTPIGDIVATPARFEGAEVRIKGLVKDVTKIPLLEIKLFVLSDDGAEIAVITEQNPPAVGDKVAVRGIVQSAAIVGGQSIGYVLPKANACGDNGSRRPFVGWTGRNASLPLRLAGFTIRRMVPVQARFFRQVSV